MDTTSIARLRERLEEDFPSFDAVARRLREAGLLPAGTAGRNGVGSAQLDYRQTTLLLLALASGADPVDAPSEAQRIGAFKLLRHDETHSGTEPRRTPFENQHLDLLTALTIELERFDENRPPSSWNITRNGACQASPDRLLFGASLESVTDPADYDCVIRTCTIPARLLADIAELFHPARAEAAA